MGNGHLYIVSFPMKNGESFHSYVNVYQRVSLSLSLFVLNVPSTKEQRSTLIHGDDPANRSLESHHVALSNHNP